MATAEPTAVATVEEVSELDCPVCHEAFTCPRVLPCGHLLCQQCLLSLSQSQPQPLCPLCQSSIVGPQDVTSGKKFVDVVEALPTDLAMEVLVKCQQLLKEDHPCQACVTSNATSMCLTCGDFYCTHCAKGHTRMSVAQDHVVEELLTLTPEKAAATCKSFCSAHAKKRSEVHCSTHGASVCLLCATTRHRQCQEVKPLDEMVEEGQAALGKMAATLTAAETQIDEAVKQLDQHLCKTKAGLKKAVTEINTMCQRLESAIKTCRMRLENLLKTQCSSIEEAVNDGKACLLARRGKLTTNKGVIQRAHGITAPDAVKGMMSSMEARLNDLDCGVVLSEDAKVISEVKLMIDTEALSCLEQQIAKLGHIKVVSADIISQQRTPFGFHNRHGAEVKLSSDRQTAERINRWYGYWMVLSADAMLVNMLYEVRIEQTTNEWNYQQVYLGILTRVPDTFSSMSYDQKSAVVVHNDWIKVNSTKTKSTVGAQLTKVRKGARVGLALSRDRGLHLFIDGKHQGLVASSIADPCYFMVDLYACWKKVTTLPVHYVRIPA